MSFLLSNLYLNNKQMRAMIEKLRLEEDFHIESDPLELAVLRGRRHLKPMDMISCILDLINRKLIDIEMIENDIYLCFEKTNIWGQLKDYEIKLLEYLNSFNSNDCKISLTKIQSDLKKMSSEEQVSVFEFFKDWTRTICHNLEQRNLLIEKKYLKEKIIISLSLFSIFYIIGLVSFLSNPSNSYFILSLIVLIIFYFVIFQTILNFFTGKINFKLSVIGTNKVRLLKSIQKKFNNISKIIHPNLQISIHNIQQFSSYWFSFDKSLDRNRKFFDSLSPTLGTKHNNKRRLSKSYFVRFLNFATNFSLDNTSEKNQCSYLNRRFLDEIENEILNKKISVDSFSNVMLTASLKPYTLPNINNKLISSLLKTAYIFEKIYTR